MLDPRSSAENLTGDAEKGLTEQEYVGQCRPHDIARPSQRKLVSGIFRLKFWLDVAKSLVAYG